MAKTLREARLKKRLTQDQLAAKSGVDQTHISSIEIGRRVPSKDVRERLAKALGTNPVHLRFTASAEPISTRDDDSRGHSHGASR